MAGESELSKPVTLPQQQPEPALSMISVYSLQGKSVARSSGFIVRPVDPEPGVCEVATVHHGVDETPDRPLFVFPDGKRYMAESMRIDRANDLAILKVPGVFDPETNCIPLNLSKLPPPLGLAITRYGRTGDRTNQGFGKTDELMSRREFSLPPLPGENMDRFMLKHSAPSERGDSGGPLVNPKTNEVVGIQDAVRTEYNLAIPVEHLRALQTNPKAEVCVGRPEDEIEKDIDMGKNEPWCKNVP